MTTDMTIGTPPGTDWELPAEYIARRERLFRDHRAGLMTEWEFITALTALWHEYHRP